MKTYLGKKLTLLIITCIFALTYFGCAIWSIVGFCLYLFKDKEFNWWSVVLLVVSYLLTHTTYIYSQTK